MTTELMDYLCDIAKRGDLAYLHNHLQGMEITKDEALTLLGSILCHKGHIRKGLLMVLLTRVRR